MIMAAIMLCGTSVVAFAAEPVTDVVVTETTTDTVENVQPTATSQTVYLQASGDSTVMASGNFNNTMWGGSYTLYYFVSEPCDLWLISNNGHWKTVHLNATGKTETITISGNALQPTTQWNLWVSDNTSWFSYSLRIVK